MALALALGVMTFPAAAAANRSSLAYRIVCYRYGARSTLCHSAEMQALQQAHAAEHLRRIQLPRNFWRLAPAEQLFVLTNVERVDRGLRPVVGLSAILDPLAAAGAAREQDPMLPSWTLSNGTPVRVWGSVWAAGLGPLDSDFLWMYDDGWGGSRAATSNMECTSPSAPGCWGHRRVMLSSYQNRPLLQAGAAGIPGAALRFQESDSLIVTGGLAHAESYAFTWAQALAQGAH